MTLQELEKAIEDHGLAAFRSEILRAARPCYSFITKRAEAHIPANYSKVGGHPDLPVGTQWPQNTQGEPLLFLARLIGDDLAEFAPQLRGFHLSFFGEWDREMTGKVILVPSDAHTIQLHSPERPTDWLPPLAECEITPTIRHSLPSVYDELESWRYSSELRQFGSRPNALWGDAHPDTNLQELYSEHHGPYSIQLGVPHRAFGYPLYTQEHPAKIAESSYTKHWVHGTVTKEQFIQSAQRWVSLLSMESDDHAGLSFGDTGNCGFLITETDLADMNFDTVCFYQDNC